MLSSAQNHHLAHVLRLRDGAALVVFDGKGNEYDATLSIGEPHSQAVVKNLVRHEPPPSLSIDLVVAISRATRMEWTLEKAVELGAASIHPVQTELGKVQLHAQRIEKRHAHWQSLVVAASAQCGRARLPELRRPCALVEALNTIHTHNRIALLPEAQSPLPSLPAPKAGLALLVGPESGFSSKEIGLVTASGWRPVRLGSRTLRAETAGPAALAAVQTLWGDWRR